MFTSGLVLPPATPGPLRGPQRPERGGGGGHTEAAWTSPGVAGAAPQGSGASPCVPKASPAPRLMGATSLSSRSPSSSLATE